MSIKGSVCFFFPFTLLCWPKCTLSRYVEPVSNMWIRQWELISKEFGFSPCQTTNTALDHLPRLLKEKEMNFSLVYVILFGESFCYSLLICIPINITIVALGNLLKIHTSGIHYHLLADCRRVQWIWGVIVAYIGSSAFTNASPKWGNISEKHRVDHIPSYTAWLTSFLINAHPSCWGFMSPADGP